MKSFFMIFEIIISALLILSVILQSRGSQAGMAFGGSGETYRSKRGVEKLLFYATIILGVLFASVSILSLVVR